MIMAKELALTVCLAIVALTYQVKAQDGLTNSFYNSSCPNAETIIRAAVDKANAANPTIPAALIRMFFHDCFVGGCDASVLIKGIAGGLTEMDGPPNANSLRGFEVFDEAKANLEAACPGVVSCADIIAYAARDAIELAANIKVDQWFGGRRDGRLSVFQDTFTELPGLFSDYSELLGVFQRKSLSEADMIVLSGAHSIGQAHCGIFLSRIWNFNGTGQADPALNSSYVATLQQNCPSSSPELLINMEESTPTTLDVNYFHDVAKGRGLFTSDHTLTSTPFGQNLLESLRADPATFRASFVVSMRRMGSIGVLTGTNGEIRKICSAIN